MNSTWLQKIAVLFVLAYVAFDAYDAGLIIVALLSCILFLAIVGEELRAYRVRP